MLSNKFVATVGVKQGDSLRPNIFNQYLNDMVDAFDKDVFDPVKLGSTYFNCLLYADDIILLSEWAAGLQKCPNPLSQYCKSWCLHVNYDKSKVMIFNKPGRLYGNYNFYINDIRREVVREYKYLGIVCSINGKFLAALSDLMNRGQKAYFKFCSLFKNASPSVRTYNDTLYNRKPLYNVSWRCTKFKNHPDFAFITTAIQFSVTLIGNKHRRCKEGWLYDPYFSSYSKTDFTIFIWDMGHVWETN